MRGESQEAFLERMFAKADAQRHFIHLEEAAAVATVQAKKNPREHRAAIAAAQRRGSRGAVVQTAVATKEAALARKRENRERRERERTPKPERIPVAAMCAGSCERMLRPTWSTKAQLPGTTATFRDRKCWACFHGGTARRTPPSECIDCGRAFRNKANPDGLVKHLAHGRCAKCAHHANKTDDGPGRQGPVIAPCVECQRPTRSSKYSLAKAPGTVKRVIGGLCQTCWRAKQKQGRAEEYRRSWAKKKAAA